MLFVPSVVSCAFKLVTVAVLLVSFVTPLVQFPPIDTLLSVSVASPLINLPDPITTELPPLRVSFCVVAVELTLPS